MKSAKFLVCTFCLPIICIVPSFAQNILHVESAETHTPLSYATIVNHTKHLLLFADTGGNANNNFENGDLITISYVGYDNLIYIFNSGKNETFFLKQKKEYLATVQIQNCYKRKDFSYNNFEKVKDQSNFNGLTWNFPSYNNSNTKVAIMITPPFKDAYLKAFSFWLFNNFQAPKISVCAPIKLSFYQIVDSSSLPGELISDRQIIYFPKKEGKQTISLDSIHLRIPENGMYIGIEYIIDDKYKYPIKYFDKEKGIDTVALWYGARFDGVVSSDFRLAFNNYFKDHWYYGFMRSKLEMNAPHGTLKCSLEISYCDDDNVKEK